MWVFKCVFNWNASRFFYTLTRFFMLNDDVQKFSLKYKIMFDILFFSMLLLIFGFQRKILGFDMKFWIWAQTVIPSELFSLKKFLLSKVSADLVFAGFGCPDDENLCNKHCMGLGCKAGYCDEAWSWLRCICSECNANPMVNKSVHNQQWPRTKYLK